MFLKRILAIVSTAAMAVSILINAMTVLAEDEIITGSCGDKARWSLDKTTGILTISGTGEMYTQYKPVYDWEYYPYRNEIKEVIVEEGITYISECAFGKFGNLTNEKSSEYPYLTKLTLPSTVKEIDGSAFYRSGLETISFSEGLEKVGEAAFAFTNLSGDFILPKSLKSIGAFAFTVTDITSVKLHSEGMYLGGSSFRNCNFLKEVIIPKDLFYRYTPTSNAGRPNGAFSHCEQLEKVIIKGGGRVAVGVNGVAENGLGQSLFSDCTSLKEIIIDCDNIEYLEEVTYHADGTQESGTFWLENNPTFYIYKDSTTEKTLKNAGYLRNASVQYIADFSALKTAISEAEDIDTSGYTDESVSVFNETLKNGKEILEDLTSTQDEVDNAVKAINDAKNSLEVKKEPSSNPSNSSSNPSDSSSNPSDSSNPSGSSSNPSDSSSNPSDSSNPSGSGQSEPSNSGSSQPTSAQPATNAPTTAAPKVTPPTTTKVVKPAKVKALRLKAKKKKLKVSWKKVSGATGYEVKAARNRKFTKGKKTVSVKKNKVTLKNLKSKKKYYVKVRAYKLANGRKYYGKWSKVGKKKTK